MDDDIPWGKIVLGALAAIIFITMLGWGLGWFSLWAQRPQAVYQEETRTQTYDSSRQYQQGTNRDIARYCEQMRAAPAGPGKQALAALIRSTASTYDGQLSDDNRQCVTDAHVN